MIFIKIANDASDLLIEAIEFILDTDISSNDLNNYYKDSYIQIPQDYKKQITND